MYDNIKLNRISEIKKFFSKWFVLVSVILSILLTVIISVVPYIINNFFNFTNHSSNNSLIYFFIPMIFLSILFISIYKSSKQRYITYDTTISNINVTLTILILFFIEPYGALILSFIFVGVYPLFEFIFLSNVSFIQIIQSANPLMYFSIIYYIGAVFVLLSLKKNLKGESLTHLGYIPFAVLSIIRTLVALVYTLPKYFLSSPNTQNYSMPCTINDITTSSDYMFVPYQIIMIIFHTFLAIILILYHMYLKKLEKLGL